MMILHKTLERLRQLYEANPLIQCDRLAKIIYRTHISGWAFCYMVGAEYQASRALDFKISKPDINSEQSLIGLTFLEVAERTIDTNRMLAVAALGAASTPFVTPEELEKRGIVSTFDFESSTSYRHQVKPEDQICIVGYGVECDYWMGKKQNLHIMDLRPVEEMIPLEISAEHTGLNYQEATFHGPENNEKILGSSDMVAITASSLVNGTFDDLLGYAKNAREICIYGDSVDMIPDCFLEAGVTSVEPAPQYTFWYYKQMALVGTQNSRIMQVQKSDIPFPFTLEVVMNYRPDHEYGKPIKFPHFVPQLSVMRLSTKL